MSTEPNRSRKKAQPRSNSGGGPKRKPPSRSNSRRRGKAKTTENQGRASNNSPAAPQSNARNQGRASNRSPAAPQSNARSSGGRKPTPPLLTNGEKGAEVHTVSEKERIHFTRLLMDLRESDQVRLELPPTLTNTERKFIHELASQLGLVSKSTGKGENRRIAVTKRNETVKKTHDEESIPVLRVGRRGNEALRQHIQRFPPTHAEELESRETGASLMEALTQGEKDEVSVGRTLAQMGLGVNKVAPTVAPQAKFVDLERRKRQHAAAQKRKESHPNYRNMQKVRAKLPAYAHRDEIVATIADNRVTIVSGDTGSGKSTQVPQFVLDANPEASIVVTQPRRISAISIGERVAEEQCLDVGSMIGYQVRLESALSRDTQLLFLTPGVLLRKLQSSPLLEEFTHVVIDEIHERDKYTEFLLVALRDMLPKRPDMRVVLMSATLQIQTLAEYWFGFPDVPAQVHLQGRTFPVQDFFLEKVLQMTGYIDAVSGDVTMEQLDADLAALTNSTSLSCVMCGRGGFAGPLELGEHVALCDGGGDTMDVVEARVRNETKASSSAVAAKVDETAEDEHSKWDGVSPYEVEDFVTSGPTLTEEELLNRYQVMHDDEQVDYDLLLEVMHLIIKSSLGDGAILVFFSGWQEISEFTLLLESTSPFHDRSKYSVLPLHSGIPSRDQRKVLQRPPRGVRKIVLSTNIAETSLTIDDVAFVIDTGRSKEKNYDPHLKTSTLQPTWISQASAKQRRGRAGRTKAGVCFRLFSSRRYGFMRPFVESELLRTPLVSLCKLLDILAAFEHQHMLTGANIRLYCRKRCVCCVRNWGSLPVVLRTLTGCPPS